jgi:hypothetical protein
MLDPQFNIDFLHQTLRDPRRLDLLPFTMLGAAGQSYNITQGASDQVLAAEQIQFTPRAGQYNRVLFGRFAFSYIRQDDTANIKSMATRNAKMVELCKRQPNLPLPHQTSM